MLLCSNDPKYPPIDVLENDTLTTLSQGEQAVLLEAIQSEDATPSLFQARQMRKLSQSGKLDADQVLLAYGRKCTEYPRFHTKYSPGTGINKKLPLLILYQQR